MARIQRAASLASKAKCDEHDAARDESGDSHDEAPARLSSAILEQTPLQLFQMRRTGLEPLTAEQHDHRFVIGIRDVLTHAPPVHEA
jgi:hypothetical protein